MLNLKEAEARLLSFLELKDGWDYGEGKKICKENVYIAIAILREISNEYIESIGSSPTDYGEVNLEFNLKNGNTLEVFIDHERNEVTSYIETQDNIEEFKIVEIKGVARHIQKEILRCKNKNNVKHMQDLYMKKSLRILKKLEFQDYLDLDPEKRVLNEEYRSSIQSVPQTKMEECVDTLELDRISTVVLANHVFSGCLMQDRYQVLTR